MKRYLAHSRRRISASRASKIVNARRSFMGRFSWVFSNLRMRGALSSGRNRCRTGPHNIAVSQINVGCIREALDKFLIRVAPHGSPDTAWTRS
jgi:hypothetical protein